MSVTVLLFGEATQEPAIPVEEPSEPVIVGKAALPCVGCPAEKRIKRAPGMAGGRQQGPRNQNSGVIA